MALKRPEKGKWFLLVTLAALAYAGQIYLQPVFDFILDMRIIRKLVCLVCIMSAMYIFIKNSGQRTASRLDKRFFK